MNRDVIIASHQGLGDHILCNGLYRSLSSEFRTLTLPVKATNYISVKRMLSDVNNIKFIRVPDKFEFWFMKSLLLYSRVIRNHIVRLGNYGIDFFLDGVRFDDNFYRQARVPFDHRWSKFSIPRDISREVNLFTRLGCNERPYIFLHEDKSRGFEIDRAKISAEFAIVEPLASTGEFTVFDYRKVLENAVEIHVIESAFAAFIESLSLSSRKFAHRYARPEASNDFRSEFTYRSLWRIYP